MKIVQRRELLLEIFKNGVHGDKRTIAAWCRMFQVISNSGIPGNLNKFNEDFAVRAQQFARIDEAFRLTEEKDIRSDVDALLKEGILEIVPPYEEFRLKDHGSWIFNGRNEDYFFCGNDLSQEPLQYIRSRFQNFCLSNRLSTAFTDEIVIAITEAAENAIKYSDRPPIIIHHGVMDNNYFIRVFNSCAEMDLNNEIDRGKFSEQVSLMRGVLVMSKLLDSINLSRHPELNVVEFSGVRSV